MYLTRCF